MKSLDFLKEGFVEDATDVHLDHEVQMAREECYHAAEHALAIHKLLRNVTEQQGLEGWVSSKITLANDYLNTVREHLEYELLQGNANDIDSLAIGMPIAETSDYARRREREEKIISGQKPARRRAPAQTSDYAKRREKEKKGVAEGSEEFNTVKTSPYKATQLLGGKYPVAFAIEVLCPDQSVVSMIQNKIGRAYQVERDNSIEGNGIGIEIVSRRFEGGQTAQAAYDQLLDFIEQNGGQFNSSTQVTIYKQKQGVAESRRDVRYHQVYGDPGENPDMRRNDYTVRDLRYGSRTYYNVPPDQEDLARKLHMIQDKEGKWFLPDFPNLSTDDTLQLLGTADSYFGRGEYFPAKRFMEPAWQTESKNTKARALAEWRKAERAKRMKEQTAGGITDTEIQQRIEPKNTNLPTDPAGMRAAGLVPAQDYDASIAAADAQNKALGSAQRSGFPTYQHQGKTYGVMNPQAGKGGTANAAQPLSQKQIQQTAGTNIVSGSGAPVTAGHKMLTPGQRMGGMNETSAGSVAGVVNPKSTKPKSQVGSLFGGTYKQKVKKNGK